MIIYINNYPETVTAIDTKTNIYNNTDGDTFTDSKTVAVTDTDT